MEEATFLTKFASKVTVVHRRESLRATPPLQRRAQQNANIDYRWNTMVTAIQGDKTSGVTGVLLRDETSGQEEDFPCDGIFIAIGHTPNTALFRGQLKLDEEGYILTRNGTETNVPGVFAAGDVQDPSFRQAVTAAGTGCMAAIQAERYLETLSGQKR